MLGILTEEELSGITMPPPPHWRLTYYGDSASFFRALPDLLPQGTVLYFESPFGKMGSSFFQQRAIDPRATVRPETLSKKVTFYHLELSQENIDDLAAILDMAIVPFPSFHFHAYKDGKLLMYWPDAFDNPLILSAELDRDDVARFCDSTVCDFSLVQSCPGGS